MLSDASVSLVLTLSLIAIPGALFTDVKNSMNSNRVSYRLPYDTRPISYQLNIATNIHRNEFDYTGSVDIRLIVIKSTDRIVIHAKDLNIETFSLTDIATNSILEDLDSELNRENWFLTIHSRNNSLNLKSGYEYVLNFKFNGTLETGIFDGFYRASYKNSKNEDIWIATTQFEPTLARKVFPCYDEPEFKANFTIAISHGSNYSAISNMPSDGEPVEREDGTIITKFLQTPPMSTYNVGFVVHNYEHIEATENGVLQRVFNPSHNKGKGQYALKVAQRTLKIMEEYFNISYPLPKLDHIPVAKRYGEAMENWGLIIYKPYVLKSSSSILEKENLRDTEIVSHEVVHQWFGNLVTMKWWSYLWLNEGIATYFGNKALQMLYPDHTNADYGAAIRLESCWRLNPAAITKNVETEKQIKHAFNPATYEKAAYVIQMFEHTFTEAYFREALSLFLRKFQYSIAEEDDFFQCLQEVVTSKSVPFFKENNQVKAVMYNWFHKKSYPVVTVLRNYENGSIKLKQAPHLKSEENDTLWYIPITITTEKDMQPERTTPDLIFPPTREYLVDNSFLKMNFSSEDWIVLNKKQIGIYRVNYDEKNWNLIIEALKRYPKTIPSHNRAQLIRDSVHFLLQNQLNTSIVFNLLSYLKYEDEIFPWCEGSQVLKQILYEMEDSNIYDQYKKFITNIIAGIFDTIESTLLEGRLFLTECITDVFELACMVEYEKCLKYAKKTYITVKQRAALNNDIERLIVCEGIKNAPEDEYIATLKTLDKLTDSEEREMLISCLAQSKQVDLVNFFLNSTLNSSEIYTPKDRSNIIYSSSKNPVAVLDTIQFLRRNHMELQNITNELWGEISFIRHNVRTQEEKEEYLALLNDVKYLGTMDYESPNELFKKDHPDFLQGQEEQISDWLDRYFESNSNNISKFLPISSHAIVPLLGLIHYFIGMFINLNVFLF